jgi:hypothetical protein
MNSEQDPCHPLLAPRLHSKRDETSGRGGVFSGSPANRSERRSFMEGGCNVG